MPLTVFSCDQNVSLSLKHVLKLQPDRSRHTVLHMWSQSIKGGIIYLENKQSITLENLKKKKKSSQQRFKTLISKLAAKRSKILFGKLSQSSCSEFPFQLLSRRKKKWITPLLVLLQRGFSTIDCFGIQTTDCGTLTVYISLDNE